MFLSIQATQILFRRKLLLDISSLVEIEIKQTIRES